MAKRRKCAETEADTKKPKQVLNAEGRGAKTRSRKKAPGIKSQGCKSDVLFISSSCSFASVAAGNQKTVIGM